MITPPTASHWSNGRDGDAPLLSVVVPYKDYDVSTLARDLIAQANQQTTAVELLFADDGSQQSRHAETLRELFSSATIAARLLVYTRNIGRAAIRNRLANEARGEYLLFLDADMLPDDAAFLQRYLALAQEGKLDITCGGRSYHRVEDCPIEHRLYRYFSQATECVGADIRNRHPLWYLLTNNLMVRRRLALERPLDESYRGWGFEDADWALRLVGAQVLHIENTASHMGLPSERELLAKYDESSDNFARISQELPEFHRFALYRASRMLSWVPLPTAWLRGFARGLVLSRALPMHLRYLGIHGYRAATYAGVLRARALQRRPLLRS